VRELDPNGGQRGRSPNRQERHARIAKAAERAAKSNQSQDKKRHSDASHKFDQILAREQRRSGFGADFVSSEPTGVTDSALATGVAETGRAGSTGFCAIAVDGV